MSVKTTSSHAWVSNPSSGLFLLILTGGEPRVVSLPEDGEKEVIIGRGDRCAVLIDDASVSREHASLRVRSDQRMTLTDLGSRNGTRLAGQSIAGKGPVDVALNQVFEVGAIIMMVRGPAPQRRDGGEEQGITSLPEDTSPPLGAKMVEAYALADLVARAPVSVLLLGETGVGKTAIAERVHAQSLRSGALIRLNCAAVPETLLEGELFGYERGAFTGAQTAKVGLIEAASEGSLLLDEIGDMPLATQAKLLHVVEQGEVMRLGATKPRAIDVRFLSATHRDLGEMVKAKTFRADLYYRVNGIAITIPPRERREEIVTLARHFLSAACTKMKRDAVPAINAAAESALLGYAWPGNLRELRNVMDRAALLAKDGEVTVSALGLPSRLPAAASSSSSSSSSTDLRSELDAFEKEKIIRALDEADGHQTKAAELVGLPLRTFVKRLTHYGLTHKKKK